MSPIPHAAHSSVALHIQEHTPQHAHGEPAAALGPLGMGLVCGLLHAVGPDHLATLAAFSVSMTPWAAAKVGASWGIGHGVGIIAVGFLSLAVDQIPGVHLSEKIESFGDYVIGLSMVLVAVYFLMNENQYLKTMEDGSVAVVGCKCCSLPRAAQQVKKAAKLPQKKRFCEAFGGGEKAIDKAHPDVEDCQEVTENTPFLADDIPDVPASPATEHNTMHRDVKSGVVGLVQGMCCPMGLVQVSYLAGAGHGPKDVGIFIAMTLLVSIMGTSLFSAFWAGLTSSRMLGDVNPRMLFRASCAIAFSLGITWIVANFFQVLDKVNYAER